MVVKEKVLSGKQVLIEDEPGLQDEETATTDNFANNFEQTQTPVVW